MNLRDLEVFQMVAKKGTITKAAKHLNYVQSNITSRIQKLETALNTKLFNRHQRGMTLTPEGKKLITYSEKILSLTNEMQKVLQSSDDPSGKLEIGTIETVIKLPQILAKYNKSFQNVDLSLYTGVTQQLQKDVLNHKLDGAFVIDTGYHPDLTSLLVCQEELVVISSNHITTLEAVKNEPFLCFSEGCAYRERLEAWYFDQNITDFKIMEFGSFETILSSVAVGLGITCVPKSAVSRMAERDMVHIHHLPAKYSHINTIFIRRANAYLTTTIEKFLETIDLSKLEDTKPLTFGFV